MTSCKEAYALHHYSLVYCFRQSVNGRDGCRKLLNFYFRLIHDCMEIDSVCNIVKLCLLISIAIHVNFGVIGTEEMTMNLS